MCVYNGLLALCLLLLSLCGASLPKLLRIRGGSTAGSLGSSANNVAGALAMPKPAPHCMSVSDCLAAFMVDEKNGLGTADAQVR